MLNKDIDGFNSVFRVLFKDSMQRVYNINQSGVGAEITTADGETVRIEITNDVNDDRKFSISSTGGYIDKTNQTRFGIVGELMQFGIDNITCGFKCRFCAIDFNHKEHCPNCLQYENGKKYYEVD